MPRVFDASDLELDMLETTTNAIDEIRQVTIPQFVIINASDNPANKRYIKSKVTMARKIGLEAIVKEYGSFVSTEDILNDIQWCQDNLVPVIVQLPIYEHLDKKLILDNIVPRIDADGFTPYWIGETMLGRLDVTPATPKGVMSLLESNNVSFKGKVALVVGTGKFVGQPLANMLMNVGCTVITANENTLDLASLVSQSDIVISCVGKANLIRAKDIKQDAVLIGVGFSYIEGKQVLDFDLDEVISQSKASLVSNRINCSGKATVLGLIDNIISLYKLNYNL